MADPPGILAFFAINTPYLLSFLTKNSILFVLFSGLCEIIKTKKRFLNCMNFIYNFKNKENLYVYQYYGKSWIISKGAKYHGKNK